MGLMMAMLSLCTGALEPSIGPAPELLFVGCFESDASHPLAGSKMWPIVQARGRMTVRQCAAVCIDSPWFALSRGFCQCTAELSTSRSVPAEECGPPCVGEESGVAGMAKGTRSEAHCGDPSAGGDGQQIRDAVYTQSSGAPHLQPSAHVLDLRHRLLSELPLCRLRIAPLLSPTAVYGQLSYRIPLVFRIPLGRLRIARRIRASRVAAGHGGGVDAVEGRGEGAELERGNDHRLRLGHYEGGDRWDPCRSHSRPNTAHAITARAI